MSKQRFSKLLPLLAVLIMIALVAAPGCKKKMPKEEAPPEQPKIEEVDTMPGDTTGEGERTLRMEMDRDMARIQIVYFAFDKSDITPSEMEKVRSNADILRKWPDWRVSVEGHCDERGTNEYNLALGERRARAAKRALEAEGIDASRISFISYGEERAADPGHDDSAWQRNRRAEFHAETGLMSN